MTFPTLLYRRRLPLTRSRQRLDYGPENETVKQQQQQSHVPCVGHLSAERSPSRKAATAGGINGPAWIWTSCLLSGMHNYLNILDNAV